MNGLLCNWDIDEKFNRFFPSCANHTVVGKDKAFMLYQIAQQAALNKNCVAEIGVFRGGTAKIIAESFKKRSNEIYLFDTFLGMPKVDADKDLHKQGDFDNTSLQEVQSYLKEYSNITFIQGFFPGTGKMVEDKKFCFVHIDVDIYRSVMDCCEFFYSKMIRGGIMVFDDYGVLTCPGAKQATDEFFIDKPERIISLVTGQCFIIKV